MDESTRQTARAIWKTAREKLDAAQLLLNANHYNDSLSRSYYAAFHAVSLLFFLHGKSFSRHSALISAFNKDFILNSIFLPDIGKAFSGLFEARQAGDYDVFQSADREEAMKGVDDARSILQAIADYCLKQFALILP